jgi:hypothetical protein
MTPAWQLFVPTNTSRLLAGASESTLMTGMPAAMAASMSLFMSRDPPARSKCLPVFVQCDEPAELLLPSLRIKGARTHHSSLNPHLATPTATARSRGPASKVSSRSRHAENTSHRRQRAARASHQDCY